MGEEMKQVFDFWLNKTKRIKVSTLEIPQIHIDKSKIIIEAQTQKNKNVIKVVENRKHYKNVSLKSDG